MRKIDWQKLAGVALIAGTALVALSRPALAQSNEPATAAVATEQEPGVLVLAVEAGSPAAEAGIRRGDILLAVDDLAVDDAHLLAATIAAAQPGDTLTLTLLHGDEERTVEVTLADRNGLAFLGVRPYAALEQGSVVARRFGQAPTLPAMPLPGAPPWLEGPIQFTNTVGLHILTVIPDSPAAAAGLEQGDLITAVDGEAVTPETDLAALVAERQPGDELTLTIQRLAGDAGEQTLTVTLGAKPDDAEAAYLGVKLAPLLSMRAEQLAMPGRAMPGPMWEFRHRMPGQRFFQQPVPPVPPMPPLPPVLIIPYGYWYGAPGYGAPYMAPPLDFIYLQPGPYGTPGAEVQIFAHPAPGAEIDRFHFEFAPRTQAQPAQPAPLELEAEVTI